MKKQKTRPARFALRPGDIEVMPDYDLDKLPPIDQVDLSDVPPPPLPDWARLS